MAAHAATHQHKRHGKHQKRTKPFLKVYWPYMPLAVIITFGLVISALWQPRLNKGVLAYATNTSTGGLLESTNQNRAANGVAALSLNSKLNQAAQAKANDMATRNYWSHNTPEGNPPWVFITQAGYDYKSAGENLAYGFATSSDTVAGWMNSPPHKANLLNSTFVDVGFGYANSSDYQNSGQQTIVVAMYASPLHPTTAPAPASSGTSNKTTSSTPQTKSETQTKAPESNPLPTEALTPTPSTDQPVAAAEPIMEPSTQPLSRIAALTHYSVPWLASLTTFTIIISLLALAIRHAVAIRKWVYRGERYVLHHMVFDVTIISLIGLCVVIGQAAGYVK